MKYVLNIRSRPSPDEPVPVRHERLVAALRRLAEPWGLNGDVRPAKEPGREFISVVQLTSHLGKGVRGSVVYSNRLALADRGSADDHLWFQFDAARVDYATLVGNAFAVYIDAMEAYMGTIQNEEFLLKSPYGKLGYRLEVEDIRPVHYIDRTLCARAFGLTPRLVASKLKRHTERAEATRSGVTITVTSEPLSFVQMKKICKPLRELLPFMTTKRSDQR